MTGKNHMAIWRSGDLAIDEHRRQRADFKSQHRCGAFSLIELMIVVAIIAVMLALTLAVTVGLSAQSDTREAQKVLTLMDQALTEWENATERKLTYGHVIPGGMHGGGENYDFDLNTYGLNKPDRDKLQGEFLKVLLRNEQAAQQLAQISGELFTRSADGTPKIVDPWGQKIVVVFPGRRWRSAPTMFVPADLPGKKDIDGTIRTDYEEQFGICANGRIMFVSSGPDRKQGDLELDKDIASRQERFIAEASDNVYSNPPLTETPQ